MVVCVAVFALLLFPVHINNYIYFNSAERYAALNITLFRIFGVFNANTVKTRPTKCRSTAEKQRSIKIFQEQSFKIFNNLTVTKVVQLGDYGIAGDGGAYAAVAQNAITGAAYAFIEMNGGRTKLKNYIILNREHKNVVYYLKVSGAINLLALIKLILILITEKVHEQT